MEHPAPVVTLLGKTVRELRLAKKLSQQQLADLAGLDRTFVNGIETGVHNPSAVTLVQIAIALDVLPSALFRKFDKKTLDHLEWPARRTGSTTTAAHSRRPSRRSR